MKKLIALFLMCLTTQAFALELAGVELFNSAQVGDARLKLNGAGVRSKMFAKVYVGSLYLREKKHTAEEVLSDAGTKRVKLNMLRELSADQLLEAFNKGLADNNKPDELAALDTQLKEFSSIFREMKGVEPGDIVTLDYFPKEGTRISLNGVVKGLVAGTDFYPALLKIWLGNAPVDGSLKKGMLGD